MDQSEDLSVSQAATVLDRWFRNAPRGHALVTCESIASARELVAALRSRAGAWREPVSFTDLPDLIDLHEAIRLMLDATDHSSSVVFSNIGFVIEASAANVRLLNVNRERFSAGGARQLWIVRPGFRRALLDAAYDLYSWFLPNLVVGTRSNYPSRAISERLDLIDPSAPELQLSANSARSQATRLRERFREALGSGDLKGAASLLANALDALRAGELAQEAAEMADDGISLIAFERRVAPEDVLERWRHPDLVRSIGLAYLAAKRFDDAEATFRLLIQILQEEGVAANDLARGFADLAYVLGENDQLEAASEAYTSAIALPEASPEVLARSHYRRGLMREKRGLRAEALADYERVIALPDAPPELVATSLLGLGTLQESLGVSFAALKGYEGALAIPEAPAAVHRLAESRKAELLLRIAEQGRPQA